MIKIKELRIEKGLYQKDIAKLVNKTIACISDWEKGNTEPSISEIVKLADFFEVSTDYLLNRTDDTGLVEVHSDLTPDQQELLDLYNRMNYRDKNQLLGFAKGLVY